MTKIDEKEIIRRFEAISQFKSDKEVIARHLEQVRQMLIRQSGKDGTRQQNIWRMIMKTRISKIAAVAVIVIAVIVGIGQFDVARVAYAQTTKAVRLTLTHLKEYLTRRRQEPSLGRPLSRVRLNKTKRSANTEFRDCVNTRLAVFAGQGQRSFFEEHEIEFSRVASYPNTGYAILDPNKADQFVRFFQQADSIEVLAPANGIAFPFDGKERMLSIRDGVAAFTLTGTVSDDQERVDLSLSFHDGEVGFKVPDTKVIMGQALLCKSLKVATTPEEGKKSHIFFLIQPIEPYQPKR